MFFFNYFWRPPMAPTFGQFPANFRFSGALICEVWDNMWKSQGCIEKSKGKNPKGRRPQGIWPRDLPRDTP